MAEEQERMDPDFDIPRGSMKHIVRNPAYEDDVLIGNTAHEKRLRASLAQVMNPIIETSKGSYLVNDLSYVVVVPASEKIQQKTTLHVAGEKGELPDSPPIDPEILRNFGWMRKITNEGTDHEYSTYINPNQIKHIKPLRGGEAAAISFKGFQNEWKPTWSGGEIVSQNDAGMGIALKVPYKEVVANWRKVLMQARQAGLNTAQSGQSPG